MICVNFSPSERIQFSKGSKEETPEQPHARHSASIEHRIPVSGVEYLYRVHNPTLVASDTEHKKIGRGCMCGPQTLVPYQIYEERDGKGSYGLMSDAAGAGRSHGTARQ